MKGLRFCLSAVILIMFLSSCFSGFFPVNEETIDGIDRQHSTRVRFQNNFLFQNQNPHRISVYIDSGRQNKIGQDVAPNATTDYFDCVPSSLFSFYLTYHLNFSGVQIPYNPPIANGGLLAYPVPRNTDTTVPVPSLVSRTSNPDDFLITDAFYFSIRNDSVLPFQLMLGGISSQLTVDGVEFITPGNTGIYRLTNQNLSTTRVNTLPSGSHDFPITTADRGKVYRFSLAGSVTQIGEAINITVNNSLP